MYDIAAVHVIDVCVHIRAHVMDLSLCVTEPNYSGRKMCGMK